jgi:hypothetical protein
VRGINVIPINTLAALNSVPGTCGSRTTGL